MVSGEAFMARLLFVPFVQCKLKFLGISFCCICSSSLLTKLIRSPMNDHLPSSFDYPRKGGELTQTELH